MTMGSDGKPRRRGAASRPMLGLVLAAMLGGCQNLPFGAELPGANTEQETAAPQPAPETAAQARSRQLAGLLDYYRGVQMAPRGVLEEREKYLVDLVTEGECDPWRLKYAMVSKALAAPGDIEKVRSLLTGCMEPNQRENGAVSTFAYILEELWETEAVSVRYREQLEATRKKLDSEQAETAKLRKQLEGLKAIEESIQQRDRDKGASGSQ
ncbi:hypothetical protein H0Z60_04210 [Ectothiorhodospiraceae bacterium WFHF3C12]|nr:hypothetical protein [Ectothiorhodospiraceae bacterium WFHF3C12]